VQGGAPQDADAVALELAALVDRLGCGWCLVWAKHDSLVAAVKAAAPELDVRLEKECSRSCYTLTISSYSSGCCELREMHCSQPPLGRCSRCHTAKHCPRTLLLHQVQCPGICSLCPRAGNTTKVSVSALQ